MLAMLTLLVSGGALVGRPNSKVVTETEREQLVSIMRLRSLPHSLVRRARIELMSADARTNQVIAEGCGVSVSTISHWRRCRLPIEIGTAERPSTSLDQPGTQQMPIADTISPTSTAKQRLHIVGDIPSEVWNRLGTRLIPKLKIGGNLRVSFDFALELDSRDAQHVIADLQQTLSDLGLSDALKIRHD
jgi:hypothetical protein